MGHKKVINTMLSVLGWALVHPLASILVVFGAMFVRLAIWEPMPFEYWLETVSHQVLIATNGIVLIIIVLSARRNMVKIGAYTGLSAPMGGPFALLMALLGGFAANVWFSMVLSSGIVPESLLESYDSAFSGTLDGSLYWALPALLVIDRKSTRLNSSH